MQKSSIAKIDILLQYTVLGILKIVTLIVFRWNLIVDCIQKRSSGETKSLGRPLVEGCSKGVSLLASGGFRESKNHKDGFCDYKNFLSQSCLVCLFFGLI